MPRCGPAPTKSKWVGWLGIAEIRSRTLQHLKDIAAEVKTGGFTHALLLGMGGSSLCPEVMRMTFGTIAGFPELHVLDSTDPAQIQAIEKKIDLSQDSLHRLQQVGRHARAQHLQAVFLRARQRTRQSRPLHRHHRSRLQDAAGRRDATTSATSSSACPASAGATRRSPISAWCRPPSWASTSRGSSNSPRRWCKPARPRVPVEENPGRACWAPFWECSASQGRDKVTLVASPGIHDLGAWLEQLIAESTGKNGKGLIPVDREPLGGPEVYGNDRVFAYLRLESAPDAAQDEAVDALWSRPGIRWCASRSRIRTTWARSSSAGRSPPRWPAPSWASTRSISPTWKPARSPRAS